MTDSESCFFEPSIFEPPTPDKPGVPPGYEKLYEVMLKAVDQAAWGKGRQRHAVDGQPFHEQQICEITRRVGRGYPLGQAIKKCIESQRLDRDAAVNEILGAINYLCADVICLLEEL